jgi:hypothetical protein
LTSACAVGVSVVRKIAAKGIAARATALALVRDAFIS